MIVDAATLLVHIGDPSRPNPVRRGLAAELLGYSASIGHSTATLTVEDVLDVAEVARAASEDGAIVVFADPTTAIDRLLPGVDPHDRKVILLDGDAAGWVVEIAPGVTAVYDHIPKEGTVSIFRRRPKTPEAADAFVRDLAARVHSPTEIIKPSTLRPSTLRRSTPDATEIIKPSTLGASTPSTQDALVAEVGCVDCGTSTFGVIITDGPHERVEEYRMAGRCYECHRARLNGGAAAARRRGWRTVLGQRGVPADWERLPIPLFSEHPDATPTPEPWGWVDRDWYVAQAVELWPLAGWPRHLLPERPSSTPRPVTSKPCHWCGMATTARTPTRKPECPACTTDIASQVDRMPLGRIEQVVGLRPLGAHDLERLRIEWHHRTRTTEPMTRPFAWLDVDAIHDRAVRSTYLADRFVDPRAAAAAQRRVDASLAARAANR